MKTKTIAQILTELVPKKGKNKSEVARRLGISSQLLGQYMLGRHEPKLSFYESWLREFGEDLNPISERNVSREAFLPSHKVESITFTKEELVTLFREIADAANDKVEKILKEQNAYLQDQVNTNLKDIEKWSFASLVDIQATIRYQAKKNSDGDGSKEKAILLEQSRIAIDVRKNLLKARKTSDQGKSNTPATEGHQ